MNVSMYPTEATLLDVSMFSKKLPNAKEYKKLKHLARSLVMTGSIVQDLAQASSNISAALEIEMRQNLEYGVQEQERLIAVAALINWSMIIYARATDTKSIKRGSFDIKSHLSEEQLKSHNLLLKIRNESLAHYGPGPSPRYPWVKEGFVLRFRPSDKNEVEIKPYFPSIGAYYRASVADELFKAVAVAHKIVFADNIAKRSKFTEEYERLWDNDPAIGILFQECQFDAEEFYGRADWGEKMNASMIDGSSEPYEFHTFFTPPQDYQSD